MKMAYKYILFWEEDANQIELIITVRKKGTRKTRTRD